MNDQDIRQIKTMLEAMLRSANHLHWIGAFTPGLTSTGSPYLLLWPANKALKQKVCRVYEQDFQKLPPFVIKNVNDWPKECANGKTTPDREEAQRTGIYFPCPLFKIVTFDGKETQFGHERRFHDVLFVTDKVI